MLGDKVTDQLHFNSLKPAGVSLLKFQPEGISAANSLVEGFSTEFCQRTSPLRKNVELRQRGAEEEDCFLVSALTGLGVF